MAASITCFLCARRARKTQTEVRTTGSFAGAAFATSRCMGILRKLFGKDTTTDILELLAAQHTEVDALFARIEAGEGDRGALFTQLADKLAAHATVEEKLFYPAVMAKDTKSQLREAVEEHLSMKRLLADLITLRPTDEAFPAKLKVLKEQVTHHAHKEEEAKLFPKVKDLLSADERAALGNEV